MASDIVTHEEYLKYKFNVKNNQIQDFFDKLKTEICGIEGDCSFEMVEDGSFDQETMNKRMKISLIGGDSEDQEKFNKSGPHYLIVKS